MKKRLEKRTISDEIYSIANYDDYLWMVNNVERVPIELIDFVINTENNIEKQVIDFLCKYNLIIKSK